MTCPDSAHIKVWISHLGFLICYYLPVQGNLFPENTERKKGRNLLLLFNSGYNFDLKKEQDRYERVH